MPPFATAAYAAAICTGVTAMPWPIGTLPIVEPDQRLDRQHDAGRLAGKSIPVGFAEPEAVDPATEPLRARATAQA